SFNIAHLTALDENVDAGGNDALFNISRLRYDVGSSSVIGATLTDRSVIDGNSYNRVAALDTRIVFGRMYFVEAQFGGSRTSIDGNAVGAPFWRITADRTGRAWG